MHDPLDRFIENLRSEADTTDFTHLSEAAVARATRGSVWRRLRTRAATVAASFTLVFGAAGGVAYAANGAVPGDTLYGIDRALEKIGIGNGGADERLTEIRSLVDSGDVGAGLHHAAETIVEDTDGSTALLEAAVRIADTDAPDGVPPLLTYLSENIGEVDGRVVADLASHIGPPADTPNGPPEDVPGGPPDTNPGGGPPDGTPGGPPDHAPGGPPDGTPGPNRTPPTTTP